MSNRHEVELDPDAIVATAEEETGEPFDDEGFRSRLGAVVDAYLAAGLSAHDRSVAAEALVEISVVRIRVAADRRRYPDIALEDVQRPIVVAGFPRAGTTFLHALLNVDPANRAPEWWAVMHPSPPPGQVPAGDHRRQLGHREVADFVRRCPGVLQAHPYFVEGAASIMECESFFTFDLRNTYPFALFRIPAYVQPDVFGDPFEAYGFHRQMLQAMQHGAPKRRWALKGTTHQFMLSVLLSTYPDAVVIWPHRDPVTVLASLVELMSRLVEGITGQPVDRALIAPTVLESTAAGLDAVIASPVVDSANVAHVRYDDVTRDYVGSLRAIYERFDLPFTVEFETAMRDWTADPRHRTDRYGRFSYSPRATGLDVSYVESRFAGYIDRFGLRRG